MAQRTVAEKYTGSGWLGLTYPLSLLITAESEASDLSCSPSNGDDADVVLLAKVLGCAGERRGAPRFAKQVVDALEAE